RDLPAPPPGGAGHAASRGGAGPARHPGGSRSLTPPRAGRPRGRSRDVRRPVPRRPRSPARLRGGNMTEDALSDIIATDSPRRGAPTGVPGVEAEPAWPAASARDLGLLGQLLPVRGPLREPPAERLDQRPHLLGEGAPDLVVVPELEAELAIEPVLRTSGPAEDVHRPHVPLVEGPLGLLAPPRVLGQPPDPQLAVPDVHL